MAQPLRIEITDGVIEPMPFAAPRFIAQDSGAMELSGDIVSVLSMDLMRTGLFRALDERAHIGKISSLNAPVEYADWKAINAQVLITGSVATGTRGELKVSFRIHDVFA
ncbi:MAG: Tol-Pal system protein TolB, partial [Paracoccaceae bacterium]